jgi:aminopeptidase N
MAVQSRRGRTRAPALAASFALLVLGAPAVGDEVPRHFGRDRDVDLQHVRIELRIDAEAGRIEGNTQLLVAAITSDTKEARFDAEELSISRVSVDDRDVAWHHDGSTLTVTFEPELDAGQTRNVRVDYSAEPRAGLHFVRPTPAYPAKTLMFWSQGESEENRYWFPVHDYPNERATSETIITVKRPLEVVGNGDLVAVTDNADGTRTYHHRLTFPHVSYLVSVAAGEWATKREPWDGVELSYHVPKARAADMDRSFRDTPRILSFLSAFIGVKYPYSVYRQTCVTDFMWGGMENITATTLTDDTLHDERAELDWPSDGLVAHEAAHQWFGDYVTCKDWSDVWLNEGFATYFAALAIGDLEGPDRFVAEVDGLRTSAIEADSGAKRRPVVTDAYRGPGELFDGHAYAKGAMVLHALRRELGEGRFHSALRAHVTEHAGKSVDTHDLVELAERVTGRDVSRFFDQWLYKAGQPELKVAWSWKDGVTTLTVRQAQERGGLVGLFDVPLDVQLLGDGWAQDEEVRVKEEQELFHLKCAQRPRALVVDPKGWLLRKLDVDRNATEKLWVLAHAPHLLSRMEAARDLADVAGQPKVTRGLVEALAPDVAWPLRREAAVALGRARGESARKALLATLASDPDSRVRTAAAEALGNFEGEPDVARGLQDALGRDRSYAVMAAAARALGKMKAPGAESTLERALGLRSHREEVFRGALDGLREMKSERTRALAERWSAYGKPVRARNHAIWTLAKLASESTDETFRKDVKERLVKLTEDPLFWTRNTAVEGLGVLEDPSAVDVLKRVAASAPESRIQRTAWQSIRDLQGKAADKAKIATLAKQLEEERDERKKLAEKLKKLEQRVIDLEDDEPEEDEKPKGQ